MTETGSSARKVNNDPDTYTWDEAMASPYRAEFLEAAQKEISELEAHVTWKEDLKKHATNGVIPCKWVFKIKHDLEGSVTKVKVRITLRGDQQKDTGDDNYSSVTAWATIRCFLILSRS